MIDYHPIQGRVEIFLVTSCYRNLNKLGPDIPLDSYADLFFPLCGYLIKRSLGVDLYMFM